MSTNVRGLIALAMVFVKILSMDFSVIATLDSSELIVNQVCFCPSDAPIQCSNWPFFLSSFSTKKCYSRIVCRLLLF